MYNCIPLFSQHSFINFKHISGFLPAQNPSNATTYEVPYDIADASAIAVAVTIWAVGSGGYDAGAGLSCL